MNFATFFSEKNLFWPEFRDINIYAQRAQYLMRCGKPQADMLIYYPFLKFPENVYNPKELLISGYLPGVEPELTKDDSRPFNSDTETNWMQQIWSLINGLNAMGITWDWVNDESLQQAAVHADNRFAFGHGLSYTTFKVSKPVYRNHSISVTVSNTGKRSGTETIQLYAKRIADTDGPIKSLRAFRRVSLRPEEKKTISFPLDDDVFTCWDDSSNTMRPLYGPYEFFVGTSSDNGQSVNVLGEQPTCSRK